MLTFRWTVAKLSVLHGVTLHRNQSLLKRADSPLTLQYHEKLAMAAVELGPLPQSVTRLTSLFADPNYELRDIVKAVELDSSLAVRLLRMANSTAYAGGSISCVQDAVVKLGAGTVRSVAMAASVRPKLNLDLTMFDLTPDSYWNHCVAVLSFAEELAATLPGKFSDEFSTSALLHDFGKLILADNLAPVQLNHLAQQDKSLPGFEREMRSLGVNHAEVGAVVAQYWKLPESIVQTVQYHHSPSVCDLPMCYGISLANFLASRLEDRVDNCETTASIKAIAMSALEVSETDVDAIFERGVGRLEATMDAFH